ncbi:hypothetical protein [Frankia sp. QA3]|uniref:hypothetical protein n=1 Tax=Frankia sp. QA3 TaxID=710111 RepID=UPI000269C943|nr:hypothetical protein [Frankia sp. QA3]EIV94990.1 hypothetical protein FraQA3DRAFT_4789 [Frankia sp. QA3]
MDDDADLAARVRRGDRQAFDDLYDLYADDVFSMCLLILGDPTVARAAAGTAFALVARTRLNPLSDPARLRSWLLELARGSALAWSGSPQARSIPVPHGVPPEELLVGAVVPAPASLRVGLARTFDRAAAVAEAAAANRRAAAATAPAAVTAPAAAVAPRKISLVKVPTEPASDAAETLIAPAPVRALPLMRMDAEVEPAAVPPPGRGTLEWRSRPAMAAAAAVVVAVVGLTAAMNWPSSDPRLMSENGVAMVSPQRTLDVVRPSAAPAAPSGDAATAPTVVPTVAGAFTSRAAAPKEVRPRLVEPIARDVHRSEPAAEPSTSRPRATSAAPSTTAPRTTPSKPPASTAAPTTTGTTGTTGTSGTSAPTTPPRTQTPQPTATVPPPVSAPPTSAAPPPATPPGSNSPPPSTAPSGPPRSAPPSTGGPTGSTEGTGATSTGPAESDDSVVDPVTLPIPVSV